MFSLFPVACVLALAAPAPPAVSVKEGDALPVLLSRLQQRVRIEAELDTLPLRDIFAQLEKEHDLKIVVNEAAFRTMGQAAILDQKPEVKQRLTGLRVSQFFTVTLNSIGVTYRLRRDFIEIIPQPEAESQARSVVSAVFKDKPLSGAVAELAEEYDATVVVAPQAGEARATPVTARLLNVPLDTALELLAVQADLRVVKRKNAYLLTTRDAATALLAEDLDKEQHKAELRQLRAGPHPAPPPAAAAKPASANK